MKTPGGAHQQTQGIVYFARMLDKIRLNASGQLPSGYLLGTADPTFFDARCTKFLHVSYDELVARTLEGGSNEEILNWAFNQGRRPSEEEIFVWNAFLTKRGWRDESSESLQADKKKQGWEKREEIQTWVDLQDAEEGRSPKFS
ncbi:MAG: hypothetical protein JWO45_1407 [Spartobacteria bacterium]|nr:hypothetical protein [Spartobacteria bacterium]